MYCVIVIIQSVYYQHIIICNENNSIIVHLKSPGTKLMYIYTKNVSTSSISFAFQLLTALYNPLRHARFAHSLALLLMLS